MKSTRILGTLNGSTGPNKPKCQIVFYKKSRLHDFTISTLTLPFPENFINPIDLEHAKKRHFIQTKPRAWCVAYAYRQASLLEPLRNTGLPKKYYASFLFLE